MKDWVTPFKETAAHVKATAALLWEMLLQGLQDWDALIVWLALNLGLGFYLRQIIFIDFHATSERTIQKYFTWAEDKRYGLGTRSTCWLSPGTVQKMLKQRLTVVQFFFCQLSDSCTMHRTNRWPFSCHWSYSSFADCEMTLSLTPNVWWGMKGHHGKYP